MTTTDTRAFRPIIAATLPAALAQLAHADPLQHAQAYLLVYLATVPDPRGSRGWRHPLVAILALAAAAMLAGALWLTAIAEWAADAPQPVRATVGLPRCPCPLGSPAETTIRRALAAWMLEVLVELLDMEPGLLAERLGWSS